MSTMTICPSLNPTATLVSAGRTATAAREGVLRADSWCTSWNSVRIILIFNQSINIHLIYHLFRLKINEKRKEWYEIKIILTSLDVATSSNWERVDSTDWKRRICDELVEFEGVRYTFNDMMLSFVHKQMFFKCELGLLGTKNNQRGWLYESWCQ